VTATTPIFTPPAALPRGRHKLPREAVAAIQRERLLAALTGLVAEKGYSAATITETARRAGVSPNVFYEHFATKQECFLAAYEVFALALLERVGQRSAPAGDWQAFVATAAAAYLEGLESDRTAARAFLLEMDAAGPETRAARGQTFRDFAATLKERHEQMRAADPRLGPLPDRAYLALVLGVRGVICQCLDDGSVALSALGEDIVALLTATLQGARATPPARRR
jgi:AcrR family transcriptional regulator